MVYKKVPPQNFWTLPQKTARASTHHTQQNTQNILYLNSQTTRKITFVTLFKTKTLDNLRENIKAERQEVGTQYDNDSLILGGWNFLHGMCRRFDVYLNKDHPTCYLLLVREMCQIVNYLCKTSFLLLPSSLFRRSLSPTRS